MSAAAGSGNELSVIFTHDMHSHFDPARITKDGVTVEKGGFAKLKTVADEIMAEYPDTFVLDAGDFSMGTPYQTIFSKEAPELRLMGLLGYDAVTLGNHEFDYRGKGLADMLAAAVNSRDKLPLMLEASIDWKRTLAEESLKEDAALVKSALERYGCKDYAFLEKGGVRMAVFGIFGKEADSYTPESGLYFLDPIKRAREVVREIQAEGGAAVIVCISHSGTDDDPTKSEDDLLAKAVPEIDLIISGHSHTRLEEPIICGDTVIASCGSYAYDLGHLTLVKSGDRYSVKDYRLIPLDGTVADDAQMLEEIGKYKALVSGEYMAQFGYEYDEVLARSDFAFTPTEDFGDIQGEDALGNLISDA
jgi:2',3'-cyclic-nucleotide 2'-phosphodiesterase (5'-nucleotidase family)